MKQLAILIMCFLVSCIMPAQTQKNVLPVQEKVYLHIDNNCYFLGDTIWYKAYVVLADDNSPEPLSRILYVELLNEQGYLMERQQLVVDHHGQADGCLAIDDSLFAGYYEVRAYTKWMMNFGFDHVPSWNSAPWANTFAPSAMTAFDNSSVNSTGAGVYYSGTNTYAYKYIKGDKGEPEYTRGGKVPFDDIAFYDIDEYENGTVINRDVPRLNYRHYSNLFSRVIPVFVRPDKPEQYRQRMMPVKITMGDYTVEWNSPEFDVKFYPEGGTLLAGHRCLVAWEAMNQQLERLNVTGVLLEDDQPIDTIRPIHAGRGRFYVNVRHGRKYAAQFTFGDNRFKFDLPKAETEGVNMHVAQDDNMVTIRVAREFEAPKLLIASVYCRGKKIDEMKSADKKTMEFDIDKVDLPEGVNQVVVHDTAGIVYADRLFFVNKCYESRAHVAVLGIPNRAYKPLEHIRLNLLATDAKRRPLRGETFSVAVRDADQLEPTFATGNVMTNLLLESEIRGFVETPDFYFEADDSLHRLALDLLLMVQGWRRYNWRAVEHPETAELDFLPEQKTTIQGDVMPLRINLFGKNDKPIEIYCSILNMNDNLKDGDYYRFKGTTLADSAGRFSFAYDPFYGNVHLTLRARYQSDKNDDDDIFNHDPKLFLRKQYFFPQTLKAYSWYETHQPDTIKDKKLTWEEFQQDIYASEWIPTVQIKAKRRAHAQRQLNRPVARLDFLDFINNVWDQGFYNQFFLMDGGEYPFVDSTGLSYLLFFDSYVRMQYHPSFKNHEAHVFHINWSSDEFFRRIKNISFVPVIDKIEVVSDVPRRPTVWEHYHEDRWGGENGFSVGFESYINFVTYPDSIRRKINGREYNFMGFTEPVEFYNPDYSNASMPDVKDYRRTLYWNPNVKTDNQGQASIDFYNNSECTTIDVSAEGVTKYGQYIVEE